MAEMMLNDNFDAMCFSIDAVNTSFAMSCGSTIDTFQESIAAFILVVSMLCIMAVIWQTSRLHDADKFIHHRSPTEYNRSRDIYIVSLL